MEQRGTMKLIEGMLKDLSPSERKIADFVLEKPDEVLSLTANQLGERSHTSSAAVIRFCKSIGFKGFQQLKLRLAGDSHQDKSTEFRDIQPGESPAEVVSKMTTNSMQTIKETADILNIDDLTEVIKALDQVNRIHFFGVGASNIIAQDAQLKFSRINKHTTAFADFHIASMHVANSGPGDVVFGISFSGETKEVLKILELANEKGATTIALTKFGPSTIAKTASICLRTSASKETTFRSSATSSRIAQLHVLDILFMSVANANYDEVIQYLNQTREAIRAIQRK